LQPALGAGAVTGWLDFESARVEAEIDVRLTDDEALLSAPGVMLRLVRSRSAWHIAGRSILVAIGRPLLNGSAADIAELARAFANDPATQRQIGGRFAVVYLDVARGVLSLATDRFGVKPLCWTREGARVSFADRADAVPVKSTPAADLQSIHDYVYFHMIPAPRTIFAGVHRVEPATLISISRDEARSERLWRPTFALRTSTSSPPTVERFLTTVREAVEFEAADGNVGCFLSGGTDSSTIAGMLTAVRGEASTFSIGFDAAGYDEMEYARLAARHFRTKHHEHYVTPFDLVSALPLVASHYDQPFGNSSAVPAYLCAVAARSNGIEKLLAGDGGDELFGGNTRYARQKVFEVWGALPLPVRSRLAPLVANAFIRSVPLLRKAASYVDQAILPMPARSESYNLLNRFGAERVFTDRFLHGIDATAPASLQAAVYAREPDAGFLDRMLAYDWRFTLADNDLPKVTGTAQLAGISVGFPLLADSIVDLSTELSARDKVRGIRLRHFFKRALTDFLPTEILTKKKHGFGLPVGPWLVQDAAFRMIARDSLESLVERGLLQPALIDDLFSRRLEEHAGYYGQMIWVLMTLELWLARHMPAWTLR